ncbi:MAG TPA: trypsin-like peptidase domain-containing protein [Longimicrobium sp.]|nr:trypsin-like peptidase domain-containing protein [Longimicrobium sp.]
MSAILGRLVAAAVLTLAAALPASRAAAQDSGLGGSENLVVLILAFPADPSDAAPETDPGRGSGIIIAAAGDTLVVATAAHVTCPDIDCLDGPPADSAQVWLNRDGERPRVARLIRTVDGRDLAYYAVPGMGERQPRVPLPLERLGNPRSLGSDARLLPVGCLEKETCWDRPAVEAAFRSRTPDQIVTQFRGFGTGLSGGGLFTRAGELVGMTTKAYADMLLALPIDVVLASYPGALEGGTRLRRPRIPLLGYRFEAGVVPLVDVARETMADGGVRYSTGVGARLEGTLWVGRGVGIAGGYQHTATPEVQISSWGAGLSFGSRDYRTPARAARSRLALRARGVWSTFRYRELVGTYIAYRMEGDSAVVVGDYPLYESHATSSPGFQLGLDYQAALRPHLFVGIGASVTHHPWVEARFSAPRIEIGPYLRFAL